MKEASVQLKKISNIQVGINLTRKSVQKSTSVFTYKALALSTINDRGEVECDKLDIVYTNDKISEEYLTKKGDIVMKIVPPYTAAYINEDTENIVVTSHFFIIKNLKNYSPILVVALLNSKKIRNELSRKGQGAITATINIKAVENIRLPKLDCETQKKYVKVISLLEKSQNIAVQLNNLQEELKNYLIGSMDETTRRK